MQKILIHKPGGYEQLKYESFPDPKPAAGEVLVKTSAIGVNYADCCVRWGVYKSAKEMVGWPICPGFEFSGTVVGIGDGVQDLALGTSVMGVSFFNAYSTHVVAPRHQIFPIPAGFTMEEAAGFPAVYLTAYHALFQNALLRPGMRILVHSAAGGVGTALLQLGRIAQCKVVGVVGSSHKVEVAKRFGADVVIDKSQQDLWKEAEKASPEGYDLILDANGHETLKKGYEHLRPTGRLVTYGYHSMLPKTGGRLNYLKAIAGLLQIPRFSAFDMCDSNKGVFGFNISFLFGRKDLLEESIPRLLQFCSEQKLSPPQITRFPFEKAGEAHQKIESGTSTGKLILIP